MPDMKDLVARDGKLTNILNFRDVGQTINSFSHKRLVAEGRLYRSARPDDATLSDRHLLKTHYGIKTVMDLRTKTEHVKQAQKRVADLKTPALIRSNDALADPVKIPGVEYLEVNINGKGFERSLLWRLNFWSFIKFIVLMLFGYRIQAINIIGREVMQPRGLIGLGIDSIDYCGPEIAEALTEFSLQPRYPILVHCTQGKDRTGLIIALLLFILDVPEQAITCDYCLSQAELLPERESRMVEIREIGLTEDFADAPADWIEKMHEHLEQNYGSVQAYLLEIGVIKEVQERIRELLQG